MASKKQPWFSHLVTVVVDESPLWRWVVGFIVVIVVFGLLYAILTPYGHGMAQEGDEGGGIDFGQGLYFSVVTVSSLGYGDLHPKGMGKVLAGLEVLMGLGFIGIVIAKLTSKRISHFVSRLFVSEMKRQLLSFEAVFGSHWDKLVGLNKQVSDVYQPTPNQGVDEVSDSSEIRANLRSTLNELQKSSDEFLDYVQAERLDSNYFVLVPASSLLRVAEAMEKVISQLGQNIISLPVQSNPRILIDVLTFENRSKVTRILRAQEAACEVVVEGERTGVGVRSAFSDVRAICSEVRKLMPSAWEQPDQSIQES